MPIEPGDPVVAVKCIGIVCKKIVWTLPVEMYRGFFDKEGHLKQKFAGANVCPQCTKWFENRVSTPVLLLQKGDEEDGA